MANFPVRTKSGEMSKEEALGRLYSVSGILSSVECSTDIKIKDLHMLSESLKEVINRYSWK